MEREGKRESEGKGEGEREGVRWGWREMERGGDGEGGRWREREMEREGDGEGGRRRGRKVDARLPGRGISNFNGARPVHPIITMMKWIRTSRSSIKEFLSRSAISAHCQANDLDDRVRGQVHDSEKGGSGTGVPRS